MRALARVGRGLLNVIGGVVIVLLGVVATIAAFILLLYPISLWPAVAAAVAIGFLVVYLLNLVRRRAFRLAKRRFPLFATITAGILAVAMIAVFGAPAVTYSSTGSTRAAYGVTPELVANRAGDKLAVYIQKPVISNGEDPILYINGGPGGPLSPKDEAFFDRFTDLGYTVYLFDSLGTGGSPAPKSTASYSIDNEVKNVEDILDHYKIASANLIAHSYGRNVAARLIERNPARVNAYVAADTAPMYSLSSNFPGQKDLTQDPSVQPPRTEPAPKSTNKQDASEFLNPLQMARLNFGLILASLTGQDRYPYGSPEEFDYFISLQLQAAGGKVGPGGKLTLRMNTLANLAINGSMKDSPDFTKNLRTLDTPPTLVVHPEFGVVPWIIHDQYRDYFTDTSFITVPGAGHGVWGEPAGADRMIAAADALFRGNPIPDPYTSTENPFPPTKP